MRLDRGKRAAPRKGEDAVPDSLHLEKWNDGLHRSLLATRTRRSAAIVIAQFSKKRRNNSPKPDSILSSKPSSPTNSMDDGDGSQVDPSRLNQCGKKRVSQYKRKLS